MINKINSFMRLTIVLFLISAIFFRPFVIFEGVRFGLDLCYNKLIPSLFPFFLVSGMFMESPLAHIGGFIFSGYLKLLDIKSRKSQSVMLLSLLGGFAVCGMLTARLVQEGEVSKKQAQLLICCCAGVSPAFAVNAIGYGFFKSGGVGWVIYFSLLCAGLLCGVLLKPFLKGGQIISNNIHKGSQGYAQIIRTAINAMLSLCGFVIAFCFINAAVVPQNTPVFIKYIIASILEVTIGCQSAMLLDFNKIYLCCGAMSVLGACAVLQMQSFCGKDISLLPFVLSRLLHLPISLIILTILLKIVPISVETSLHYSTAYKLPADTCAAFFILLIAFFFDFSALNGLRNKKFEV